VFYIKSELTKGILYEYRQKVIENLIYKVDADLHAETYIGNKGADLYEKPELTAMTSSLRNWQIGSDMYAEPEFTGKYVDLCMKIFRDGKNQIALENAKKVVDSIIRNQRADGFLGCLPKGKETLNFGVWNQAFTLLGLVSYYQGTGDERALEAARKSVSYVMEDFVEGKSDILDALNGGTQHISILYFICLLYKATKEEKYKKYILFIVETIKHSDLNFFEFEDILELKSRKGIENFIILLGILEYADIFDDKEAILSVEKYWQQVADTQIRNTGNGTINEFWTEGGNGCMLLGEDIKANETCVAVGWIQLSLALFYLKQDAKYLDEVDKTVYNHILASILEDGSDFAYYQPNYGKKVKAKEAGLYKCCRYRGFTLFTYMDEMLYYEDENSLIPMLYTSGCYLSKDTRVVLETNYPFERKIKLSVLPKKEKMLKLRIPKNCHVVEFLINGCQRNFEVAEKYIVVELEKDISIEVEIMLEYEITTEHGMIDDTEYCAFAYGCVLLAAKNVNEISVLNKNELCPKMVDAEKNEKIAFTIGDIRYCDYASAEDYSVWMPLK